MTEDRLSSQRGPLPPVLFLAAMGLMVALHVLAPVKRIVAMPWRVAGGVLIVAALVLNLWADRLFKNAGTTVKPFDASTSLVRTGPFAFTRNPMYVGMLLALAGVAIALGSATPWLVVPLFAWVITKRFIVPEERKLEAAFGSPYLDYKAKVRRWL